jgi:hypothetical protein
MDVFALLSFRPEARSYFSNNLISLGYSAEFSLQNNRLLSEKKRWLSRWPRLDIGTLERQPEASA